MVGTPSVQLGVLTIIVAASAIARLWPPWAIGGLAVGAAIAVACTPGGWRIFMRRLRPLVLFSILAAGLVLVAPVAPTEPALWLPGWPRPISARTASFMAGLWVKSALIVAWVTAFAERLSDRDLLEGILGLPVPRKLASILYFIIRGLKTLFEEVHRMQRARDARSSPQKPLRALKVAGAMTQTLMVRLGQRAETMGLALAARGYDGSLKLLNVRRLSLLQASLIFLCGGLLLWLVRL